MKIEIDIPKEFESEYIENKFQETFARVLSDIHWNISKGKTLLAGNYEYETLNMLGEAIFNSKEIKAVNNSKDIKE